jgi:DNA invertase Pin-like site-specific DNA recombinase
LPPSTRARSTEQIGDADEQKSVARQIDHARLYATGKGWIVADEHVYIDDGIAGAEFANRPGFLRLMNALKPRPSFQVLVMSEESLTTFADELEREKARQRTYDAMSRKARAGHVTGGRVFWYDNVEILSESLDGPEASRTINGVMAGAWLSERLAAVLERARFDPAGRWHPPTEYVFD